MNQEELKLPEVISQENKAIAIVDLSGLSKVSVLTPSQLNSILMALNSKAYDMASEYIWKRSISRLKNVLSGFEIDFLADMLDRTDVKPYDSLDTILNDYNIIKLTEQLGMITHNAALHLRHSSELLQHYFSSNAQYHEDLLSEADAIYIINSCITYILNVADIPLTFKFSELKRRIKENDLKEDDEDVQKLYSSSLFFIRTIITLLLKAVKRSQGVELDHTVNNLSLLVPVLWERLNSEDRWKIGTAYRDAVTEGNDKAAKALKLALLKLKGFDYVPETLRSNTFIDAAKHLIDVHYGMNNFYNEPRAVKDLEKLGTVIPEPAFAICIKAYLLVYTGNYYGVSYDAISVAYKQLGEMSNDNWIIFFDEILPTDYDLLSNLEDSRPMDRMSGLMVSLNLDSLDCKTIEGKYLFNTCKKGFTDYIKRFRESKKF